MSILKAKVRNSPLGGGDLGKPFNLPIFTPVLYLTMNYGLCPQIQPPKRPNSNPACRIGCPSAARNGKCLGEEMRLLYVAMTRAGQRLILVGAAGKNSLENNGRRKRNGPGARRNTGLPQLPGLAGPLALPFRGRDRPDGIGEGCAAKLDAL